MSSCITPFPNELMSPTSIKIMSVQSEYLKSFITLTFPSISCNFLLCRNLIRIRCYIEYIKCVYWFTCQVNDSHIF
ncbi:hypothetical protein KM1_254830 [Entamoeba histolytica HM-3:IMSS]|uniref:Uncharacterized protein n=1 Tax=Entamoeba histolytica HM-3:IMSS TaxID=885315 RepID=M7WT39_ENTHI|nr:hypothetical protein KM1_254830 [Entamoeba histolytica HM-3:IMSS]